MIYLLVALCFVLLLAYLLRDTNPYKLIMIFGKKGTGKTSDIAKDSQKWLKKGYKVYTNCQVAGCYDYDPEQIGLTTFPANSVIYCDEVSLIWHNRDFKNFKKCVMQWFRFQRKYKVRVTLYSQSFDVDKVLRDLVDTMYLMNRLGPISIKRPIYKKIGITQDSEGNGKLADVYSFGPIWNWKFTFLPRYYGLFTSFNAPELPMIESVYQSYDDYSSLYVDTKKWLLLQLKLTLDKVKRWYDAKIHKKESNSI